MQNKLKELKYGVKMESFSKKEVKERIRFAMNYVIPKKIQPIPYMGKINIEAVYEPAGGDKLISRCPVTGLVDFYDIRIKIIPDKLIPELKSVRDYLRGYAELPISHEHLVAKVFKDFVFILSPKWISIHLDVAIRGGLKTTVHYEYKFKD